MSRARTLKSARCVQERILALLDTAGVRHGGFEPSPGGTLKLVAWNGAGERRTVTLQCCPSDERGRNKLAQVRRVIRELGGTAA
ncbi:MAG: hypothetical protein ACJ8FU_08315 [Xanthobacteraceae bacterium]